MRCFRRFYASCKLLGFVSFGALLAIPKLSFADDELPRRIALGTQVQPVTEATRQKLGLRNTRGVEVMMVVPESTAAAAGIEPGDVILGIADRNVPNPAKFVEVVGSLRTGSELEILLNRNGEEKKLKSMPKQLPYETSPDLDIEYGSVTTPVGRLRTVITLPKEKQELPAVVLLSGLGLGPAEHPTADPIGMRGIAYELNKHGFAVLRVDRPGCGDSEGGPAREADLRSIIDGYVAGVRAIKKHPRIDPKKILLFGPSIGGVQAPLVAQQEPVQAIAVFGTMSMKWIDYLSDTTRRQSLMAGADEEQIKQSLQEIEAGWKQVELGKLTPDEIAEEFPDLIEWVEQTWTEGQYFSGITYKFFQQLCQADIESAWKQFDGPVLAMWGESDFVTSPEDHQKIADIANQRKAGQGAFQRIVGVDHQMRKANSMADAMRKPGMESAIPIIVEALAQWANAPAK